MKQLLNAFYFFRVIFWAIALLSLIRPVFLWLQPTEGFRKEWFKNKWFKQEFDMSVFFSSLGWLAVILLEFFGR
jgi:hypothetical protein